MLSLNTNSKICNVGNIYVDLETIKCVESTNIKKKLTRYNFITETIHFHLDDELGEELLMKWLNYNDSLETSLEPEESIEPELV